MSQSSLPDLQPNAHGKWLRWVERAGNKLPHPFMLFVYLSLLMILLSVILSAAGVSVVQPGKDEVVEVKSLLSQEGIHWILTDMLKNFTNFQPLGLVLGMALGIGLAEQVGLIQVLLRKMILKVPAPAVTFMVIFSGILGNLASDAAFVIIPPLAAMVFHTIGRHPLAGLAAGFAGVGSGFTANFIINGTDGLLSGITTTAAHTVDKSIQVTPVDNWYFMSASVFLLAGIGTWITNKIVEPRLGSYQGNKAEKLEEVTSEENKALRYTGVVALIYLAIMAFLVIPEGALLRDPETGTIIPSPFLNGIIPILLFFFIAVSVTYGIATKQISSQKDVPQFMGEAIKRLAPFIVMVFAAAQFIAYFEWTHIGVVLAVNGAELLTSIKLTGLPVIVLFTLLTALLNLVIFSGSAQWALMAPVFVPLFMLLGYDPAFIQLAYRIADSSTNTISPLNPYLPIILVYMQKYKKDAGIGTMISMMLPYSLLFLAAWIVLMIIWYWLGLPIGPGAGFHL